MLKHSGWFIALLIVLASCLDDPDCFSLNNNIVGFSFRVYGSSTQATVLIDSIIVNGADSVFQKEFSGNSFQLPLDLFNNSTSITLKGFTDPFNDGADKTLTLDYSVKSQFVSQDCGARFVFSDLKVREGSYDFNDVKVISATPGNGGSMNVEIYRCPIPNLVGVEFRKLTMSAGVINSELISLDVDEITSDYISLYPAFSSQNVVVLANPNSTSTTYNFNIEGSTKILALDYTPLEEQRYEKCGTQTFITDMKVNASSTFDSLRIFRETNNRIHDDATDPAEINVQLYQCPITNLIQIAFRQQGRTANTTISDTLNIKQITATYNAQVFYQDSATTSVILPLDENSSSSTFVIQYDDRPQETVTLNYTNVKAKFKNVCSTVRSISNLTVADLLNATVVQSVVNSTPATNIEIRH